MANAATPVETPAEQQPKEGYLVDYISGLTVRDTPEEREAVQVFSKILVDDYGYDKKVLQTHPQWRVVSVRDKWWWWAEINGGATRITKWTPGGVHFLVREDRIIGVP